MQENHGVLVHPNWVGASQHKNTLESFSTIDVHNEQLSQAVNDIELENKPILTPDLCKVTGVKLPFPLSMRKISSCCLHN